MRLRRDPYTSSICWACPEADRLLSMINSWQLLYTVLYEHRTCIILLEQTMPTSTRSSTWHCWRLAIVLCCNTVNECRYCIVHVSFFLFNGRFKGPAHRFSQQIKLLLTPQAVIIPWQATRTYHGSPHAHFPGSPQHIRERACGTIYFRTYTNVFHLGIFIYLWAKTTWAG